MAATVADHNSGNMDETKSYYSILWEKEKALQKLQSNEPSAGRELAQLRREIAEIRQMLLDIRTQRAFQLRDDDKQSQQPDEFMLNFWQHGDLADTREEKDKEGDKKEMQEEAGNKDVNNKPAKKSIFFIGDSDSETEGGDKNADKEESEDVELSLDYGMLGLWSRCRLMTVCGERVVPLRNVTCESKAPERKAEGKTCMLIGGCIGRTKGKAQCSIL